MSYAVVFNTFSGHRSRHWNEKLLTQLQHELDATILPYPVDSLKGLHAALTDVLGSDAHTLIISGGDGTLNRTVNALLSHPDYRELALALIPNGTGNSFALDLNIKTPTDTIEAIKQGKTQQVDVGEIITEGGRRFFINNFGVGLVYDITRLASKMRPIGALSYVIATLIKLIRLPSLRLSLTIDGHHESRDVLFLDICNSQYTGGDMRMAPNIKLDDRQFQLISVPVLTRRLLLKTFPKLFNGSHVEESFVTSQMVKRVHLRANKRCACILDGDLADELPLTVAMTNQTLTFYCL